MPTSDQSGEKNYREMNKARELTAGRTPESSSMVRNARGAAPIGRCYCSLGENWEKAVPRRHVETWSTVAALTWEGLLL